MKSLLKPIYFILLLFLSILSCEKEDKTETEIAKINIDFTIERFDKAFAEAKPEDLPKLKETFPFMFPKKYDDSFWVATNEDTLQLELQNEVLKQFQDLKTET